MIARSVPLPSPFGPACNEGNPLYVRLVTALNDHSAWIFALSGVCLALAGGLAALVSGDGVLMTWPWPDRWLPAFGRLSSCEHPPGRRPIRCPAPGISSGDKIRPAFVYCGITGLMSVRVFAWEHPPIAPLLVLSLAVGTLGTLTMNAVRPRLVRAQQFVIHLPLGLGVPAGGGQFWPLWIAGVPYVGMSALCTRYLYRIMVDARRDELA